jgi:uncharacterized membrane protein
MILYNSLMGIMDGVVLLLVAGLLRRVLPTTRVITGGVRIGYSVALLLAGTVCAVLGAAMTLTWPLKNNAPLNKFFGEPTLLLGLLAVGAGVVLLAQRRDESLVIDRYWAVTLPIAVTGAYAIAQAIAAIQFGLVQPAPPQEPIFGDIARVLPGLDNFLWGLTYAGVGVAALLAPLWHHRTVRRVAIVLLSVFGAYIIVRSALGGGYAQIGLLVRFRDGV